MTARDAHEELKWTETLAKIDPQFNWFYYPYKLCKPDATLISGDDLAKCSLIEKRKGEPGFELVQVQLPTTQDAVDLAVFAVKRRPSVATVVQLAIQVLEGVQRLSAAGVIHNDIKAQNVLVLDAAGTQARLIDFGIAMTFDRFYDREFVDFDNNYPVFPPEYRLIAHYHRSHTLIAPHALRMIDKPYVPVHDDIAGYTKLTFEFRNCKTLDQLWKKFRSLRSAGKVDVYSVGAMLATTLPYCHDFGTFDWKRIEPALKAMTAVHPKNRPTPQDAIRMLEAVIQPTPSSFRGGSSPKAPPKSSAAKKWKDTAAAASTRASSLAARRLHMEELPGKIGTAKAAAVWARLEQQ